VYVYSYKPAGSMIVSKTAYNYVQAAEKNLQDIFDCNLEKY